MKLAALILTSALAIKAPMEKNRVYILCYHGFLSDKTRYSFLLDELKSQLDNLSNNGFKFVSLSDVLNNNISGYKNVMVSVDDGNKTVYDAYYKVFKPMGIRPILAIYPAIINVKDYALTWDQLKELSNDGCDIAAHGYNHLFVNEKLYRSDKKAFMREIYKSKSVLEEKLSKQVDIFIYPFGVRSEITGRTLREAGYKYAFTIDGRRFVPSEMDGAERYELPRYIITRDSWKYTMKEIALDSVSSKPMLAMKNRKGHDGKKISNDNYKPVAEPKVMREKYIYNDIKSGGFTYGDMVSPVLVKSVMDDKKNYNEKVIMNTMIAGDMKNGSYLSRIKEGCNILFSGFYNLYYNWITIVKNKIESLKRKADVFWNTVLP